MREWIRLSSLVVALALTGCSLVEPEQRPAPGATLRSTGQPAAPAPGVAFAPAGAGEIWPATAPAIRAKAAILIDASTGRTIYQKNADLMRQVASTQKLLTALIVADGGNLDAPVRIQASDTYVEPTKAGFRAGQVYPRRELLKALLVHSCNDAAMALARDNAGSVAAFCALMDARASALGARSSHFVNPNGLPGAQYSTARDMARIAYRAYRYPELREIMRLRGFYFRFNSGRSTWLKSTNKLLGVFPGVDGMKTGFTNAAGRCLVTSATLNGRSFILVQLGSRTSYIFDDAAAMLQWAALR